MMADVYETFATLLVVLNVDGSSPTGHPSKGDIAERQCLFL